MRGCIQPMSSPIMKRMLGFCCCAVAGGLATNMVAHNASVMFLGIIMHAPPDLNSRLLQHTSSLGAPGMSQPHSTLRHNVFNARSFDLGQCVYCDRAGEDHSGRVFQADEV